MIGTVYKDLLQGSPEWFEKKMGLVSTSNFNDILAKRRDGNQASSRRNYRARIVLERLNGKTPSRFLTRETDEIRWGKDTEDLARLEYQLRTGRKIVQIGGIEHGFMKVWSSTDGVDDPDNIKRTLEIKCFNSANHLEVLETGKVPAEYRAQVDGELWITEADVCDFVSYDPDFPPESQFLMVEVQRDQKRIDDLAVEVSKFLEEVDEKEKFVREYKTVAL